ncbi:YIP1 family protein [Desulfonatronovibrio hydrogenovorans]|uniref:YIP1 family protein n=1 Tax=Desulfonatronovibrio hydrogenovorans TaxID=53245 RepID=UPI00048BCA4F|nr:YIP1 family protein [Desulfonatronovibrio hydrogenovorans]
MRIICPKCQFLQNVPDEKIPPKAEKATCPKCGEKFRFRTLEPQDFVLEEVPSPPEQKISSPQTESDQPGSAQQDGQENDSIWSSLEDLGESDHPEPESVQSQGYEVPWENLEQTGFFPGFIETVKRVMLAPSHFFYKMPFKGLVMPLAFFLIISVLQAMATFIWNMAGFFPTTAHHGAGGLGMGMMGLGSFFIVIVYPLFMGLWLFIASGVTHLFLTFFQAGKSGFEGTFRATAYGSAPMILGLLPFLGPLIGALWSLGVTIIGYKQIHETSFVRVVMAMLTPLVVIMVLAVFMY